MTTAELKRANWVQAEIEKLEHFVNSVRRTRRGKLISEKQRFVFNGMFPIITNYDDYEIEGDIKIEVIKVLENHLRVLKAELEEIGGKNDDAETK